MVNPLMKIQDEIEKMGKFNEGTLQTLRLHWLQDQINKSRATILLPDIITGIYGYQNTFNCLSGLKFEVWSKLKSDEKDKMRERENKIRMLLLTNPPFEDVHDAERGMTKKFNAWNWHLIQLELTKFEEKIKEMLDSHGLSNPERDDTEGL